MIELDTGFMEDRICTTNDGVCGTLGPCAGSPVGGTGQHLVQDQRS